MIVVKISKPQPISMASIERNWDKKKALPSNNMQTQIYLQGM